MRGLCQLCAGTDVQHVIGEPCLWEQMASEEAWNREQEEIDRGRAEEEYYQEYGS